MRQHRIFIPILTAVAIQIAMSATTTTSGAAQPSDDRDLQHKHHESPTHTGHSPSSLPVPPDGKIPVALVIGKDAEVLDFCGPLEVFAQAYTKEGKHLFAPYTVAAALEPVRVGGGMKVAPDHTFKTAPAPKIIVIPAMDMAAATPEMIDWIRHASKSTDVTMSVCTGAFVLAKTGLLSGKRATTHHGGYFRFAGMYPEVSLKRGARFVEDGNIATAGGVSSGIDLSLRLVERYVGRDSARQVADVIEYQGKSWINPDSNESYATMPPLDENCPLCFMAGNRAIKTVYHGKTYYFCAESEKEFFEKHLDVFERFLAEDAAHRAGSDK